MKKYFRALGLMVAAAFTLTNCAEQIDAPVESAKVPFEIIASTVETKTAAGDNLSTVWTEGDALNVFHEYAGSEDYKNDGKFELAGDNVFKGALSEALGEGCYNWYAFYPYTSYMTDPVGTKGYMPIGSKKGASQTQNGNDSMAHIAGENYPLAGRMEDYEGGPVEVSMSHLSSLLEVVVTNTTSEDLVVNSVSFTGTEPIIGTYYIEFTGETPVFKSSGDDYVSNTANLVVNNGEAIPSGSSAKFYLAVKPFTATADKTLKFTVNGYEKEQILTKDVTFVAGKIKTVNFNYDKVSAVGEYTIDWTSANDWVEKATKYISGYYTVKTLKNDGSTEPTVNGSAHDCRVYANGSITISHSASVNIKKIVFNVSENGKKRLADIAPSTGSVTIDQASYKVIWEGSASNVTFTVGDVATYGTEGDTKAGQLCFDSIDVVAEPTDAPYVAVLKAIELKDMTTEYKLGDNFEFDGTLTAHYYNQDSKVVNPTEVTVPDMTTVGTKMVEVKYTEDDITLTASYSIYIDDPNAVVGETKTSTIDFASMSYTNGQTIESVTSGDVEITFNKGTNNNPPKYYNTGTAIRCYGGNTFTISAGTKVKSIEFTFSSGEGTNAITADSGNYSNNTWTGQSSSVKFTIGGTSGHRRISQVKVTYEN